MAYDIEKLFQLTPSRRATAHLFRWDKSAYISTHALTEGDRKSRKLSTSRNHFNSRPHGGRLLSINRIARRKQISTHALTEGDKKEDETRCAGSNFNSRPHGGRLSRSIKKRIAFVFQLTPSRRATGTSFFHPFAFYFNSRPHGGRHWPSHSCFVFSTFQLTPSRRATQTCLRRSPRRMKFQLTPSRRATICSCPLCRCSIISTHALTEGDWQHNPVWHSIAYFNSRPHGGRRIACINANRLKLFQLTPSRRATKSMCIARNISRFQLTPSRRATRRSARPVTARRYFNSRPHGGRREVQKTFRFRRRFQLTPSRRATRPDGGSVDGLSFQLTPSRRATVNRE